MDSCGRAHSPFANGARQGQDINGKAKLHNKVAGSALQQKEQALRLPIIIIQKLALTISSSISLRALLLLSRIRLNLAEVASSSWVGPFPFDLPDISEAYQSTSL